MHPFFPRPLRTQEQRHANIGGARAFCDLRQERQTRTADKNGRLSVAGDSFQARRRADSPPDDHSNADVESGAEALSRL